MGIMLLATRADFPSAMKLYQLFEKQGLVDLKLLTPMIEGAGLSSKFVTLII